MQQLFCCPAAAFPEKRNRDTRQDKARTGLTGRKELDEEVPFLTRYKRRGSEEVEARSVSCFRRPISWNDVPSGEGSPGFERGQLNGERSLQRPLSNAPICPPHVIHL